MMHNCVNCGASGNGKMLYRTVPVGQVCKHWICAECKGNIDLQDLNIDKAIEESINEERT
jgi:hypothetical protein